MRRMAAVAGVVVAFAVTPALAQPTQPAPSAPPAAAAHSSSWRAAVAAALAFGHAEGKAAALARHAMTTAPATRQAIDATLDKLDRLASAARDAYVLAKAYNSPFWAVAAEVRLGDTFVCQAEKIVTIPMPPQVAASLSRLPPSVAADYRMFLEGLVDPLRRQAIQYWERAAAGKETSPYWSGVARDRLTGSRRADC